MRSYLSVVWVIYRGVVREGTGDGPFLDHNLRGGGCRLRRRAQSGDGQLLVE